MNVRPADSNALAATDFFAATSPCYEMGPIPFERLLRTPTPPPLERPPARENGNRPASCTTNPASPPVSTNESQSVHDNDQTQETTDQQLEEEATKSSSGDDPHPATDITAHDRPRGETSDSQRDVAAESLQAASTVPTAPLVVEEAVKLPDSDPTLADVLEAGAKESDDATSAALLAIRAGQTEDSAAATTSVLTTQPVTTEQGVNGSLAIQPPLNDEPTTDEPNGKGRDNAETPPHGIGVLPSISANAKPAPQGGKTGKQPGADVRRQREPKEASAVNELLVTAHRSNDMGELAKQRDEMNQTFLPLPPADAGSMASAEPLSPATSPRAEVTEPRGAGSAPSQSPVTAPVATAGIGQRLPNHVLVRSNNNPAAEPGALQIDTARFIQRVARAFDSAREQGTDVRLRLSPPELGALRVEVNLVDQGLVARVEAETPEARAILLENLPALRHRLAEQGIKLERFDVDLSQQRSNQDHGHEPHQPQDRQSPAQTRTPRPVTVADVSAPNRPTSPPPTIQDRRLNVIV